MPNTIYKGLKLFFVFLLITVFSNVLVYAQTPTVSPTPKPAASSKISELSKKIAELESKVSDLRSQGKSLSSQISAMDNQIKLMEYRIAANEQEIDTLTRDIDAAGGKMKNLESSLSDVSKVLINRIVATYESGGAQPIHMIASSNDLSSLFVRANYLRIVQAHDKKLMYNAQQAKNDYANQKNIFEQKKQKIEALKAELEGYNAQLDKDKESKQQLLTQTKGSEATFQALLAETKAEYEAIQGIVSGRGNEGEVGPVEQGGTIATIKQGASCNSSGSHLHFTVSNNGAAQNPFNYLKSVDHKNQSGGDSFNPSGSWDWPISPSIQFNQGYGNTSFASGPSSFYSFHNGLDINSSSSVVRAVQAGTLFQGSYTGNGGCRLQYVRVRHTDGGLDSFYLHVNYAN